MIEEGKRLAYYRKKKRITQQKLAEALNVSRSLVGQWETGKRSCEYLPDVCRILDVDEGKIKNDVSTPNQTLHEELGLSDDAIEYLKRINSNRDIPFTDAIYNADFSGMVDGDGNSNLLILKTLNLILSTNCGDSLLSAIGNYCFADFSKGYPVFDDETLNNRIAPVDSWGNAIPADSIRFNVSDAREGCSVSLDLLKFALLKAIENYVEMLRMNVKGEE